MLKSNFFFLQINLIGLCCNWSTLGAVTLIVVVDNNIEPCFMTWLIQWMPEHDRIIIVLRQSLMQPRTTQKNSKDYKLTLNQHFEAHASTGLGHTLVALV